jgi:hypothetical protein
MVERALSLIAFFLIGITWSYIEAPIVTLLFLIWCAFYSWETEADFVIYEHGICVRYLWIKQTIV